MTETLCKSVGDAMTNTELKDALLAKRLVLYNGILYKCVHEIVYRANNGAIQVTAGLLDFNGNCIVYADPRKVSVADES